MELKPGAHRFILRNGFYDWNNEVEASVQVEVVEGPMSGPVPVLTPSEFVSDMTALSLRLSSIPQSMLDARDGWPLNDVNEPDPGAFGIAGAGIPTAVSSAGRYSLDKDEALIIETPMPCVVHGGVQLGNVWVESIRLPDPPDLAELVPVDRRDSDGIIRYVLARQDPSVPNWLDISGHPRGGIFMRWQSPTDEKYPDKPTVKRRRRRRDSRQPTGESPELSPEERAGALLNRYRR